MKKLGYLLAALVFAACGNGENKEVRLDGLKGKIKEVQTLVYLAEQDGEEIKKAGKPDPYHGMEFFPAEETCFYNEKGQEDSVYSVIDVYKYVYKYEYDNDKLIKESTFVDGEIKAMREFIYNEDGTKNKTMYTSYYGSEPSTQEEPETEEGEKVVNEDGTTTIYGYSKDDYTVKDADGRILKETYYNEMEEARITKEFSYDENGWITKCRLDEQYDITYEYPEIDEKGNWTKMVIKSDNEVFGLAERNIKYYE